MKNLVWVAAILAGCGSDPVDAEGTYTLAVTNRDNGCNFPNWNVGESASNIGVNVTQEGDDAVADVMGGTRVLLDIALGDHIFRGKVDGSNLDLKLTGTKAQPPTGNCNWTVDAVLDANLAGDVLTGRLEYIGNGNDNTDCAAVTGCVTYQDFNGTRPPQ